MTLETKLEIGLVNIKGMKCQIETATSKHLGEVIFYNSENGYCQCNFPTYLDADKEPLTSQIFFFDTEVNPNPLIEVEQEDLDKRNLLNSTEEYVNVPWEYKFESGNLLNSDFKDKTAQFGKEGWEMINFQKDGNQIFAVFKRIINEKR